MQIAVWPHPVQGEVRHCSGQQVFHWRTPGLHQASKLIFFCCARIKPTLVCRLLPGDLWWPLVTSGDDSTRCTSPNSGFWHQCDRTTCVKEEGCTCESNFVLLLKSPAFLFDLIPSYNTHRMSGFFSFPLAMLHLSLLWLTARICPQHRSIILRFMGKLLCENKRVFMTDFLGVHVKAFCGMHECFVCTCEPCVWM